MKKLLFLIIAVLLSFTAYSKERPIKTVYDGEPIISIIDYELTKSMSDKELTHYLYENTNMIRHINVEPQDTLHKLSNYEKYILAKEGKPIPYETQDSIIHDTVYIEVEAEQSQDIDIYVNTYPTYSRFFIPYFSHNWYGYGYDSFFYDPFYYDYGWYGYNHYYHNHWYSPWYSPYYYRPIYVYNSNRYRQGVATGTLGSRRYASNPNPWNRTYSSGYISAPNKSSVKNMATTRAAASQQRAIVQKNIQASQRPTYNEAVRSGDRKTYTPTYTNPRMRVRPEYNTTKRTSITTQSRTQTTPQSRSVTPNRNTMQNRTQSRITTPQKSTNSYIAPSRSSSTINRSTPTRSTSTVRSTSTSRGSSSVGRSTTTSRSSSSSSAGRGKK